MEHVQMVDGGQRGSARVRLDSKDVEVVATLVGRGKQHAGVVEGERHDSLGVGNKVSDHRIGAVGSDRSARRRAGVLDGVLKKREKKELNVVSLKKL